MTAIIYKEFYNKDCGLPEPVWGQEVSEYGGIKPRCPTCGSKDLCYSGSPDDPEEILIETVRCKNCGRINDWYEAYRQEKYHHTEEPPLQVVHENPTCSS